MATLLVTAFGAFPGAPANPSADIARALARVWRPKFATAGVRLVTAVLPVVYAVAPHLDALAAREKPDAILHLGLAGSRRRVSVELRARNFASVVRPDARGAFAVGRVLRPGGARTLRSGWNARRLVAALRAQRIDAHPSVDAGDYVCNATLWRSLETGRAPAIFVHVPKKRHAAPATVAAALARILPAMTLDLARARSTGRRAEQETR